MLKDKGLQTFGDILKNKQSIKPPAYEWQDFALRIVSELGVPHFKRSAVFKVCKENQKIFVERCVNETKELCRSGEKWKYFFKVVDNKGKPK